MIDHEKQGIDVTLDRIWEVARQKRRQADVIEEKCKELAVLFGSDWTPPLGGEAERDA